MGGGGGNRVKMKVNRVKTRRNQMTRKNNRQKVSAIWKKVGPVNFLNHILRGGGFFDGSMI